jgi:hypothetical protein
VKQKLLTHMDRLCSSRDISGVCVAISEHLSSPLVFRGVRVTRSLILLWFFFWPLCCLFFEIRIMIAPLVSSNSSFLWSTFSTIGFPFVNFSFGDCILVPCLNYSFWLSIWYIQTFLAWNDIIFRAVYNYVLIGALDSLDCIMNSTFHWIVLFNFNKDLM